MANHQLAQINIARLVAPLDDPAISGFVSQLAAVNRMAEDSPGFVWRLTSETATEDPFILVNMSVWTSVEALKQFTYQAQHLQALRDRAKWFRKMDLPHYCLWWIPSGHIPAVQEGTARLELYQRSGSTPDAFSFPEPHPAPSQDHQT